MLDNILTRLKHGVSPLKENVFSCSIHPGNKLLGILELSNKDILLINKPKGISSAQAVNKIKKSLGVKKAGHAGTLDKEAEGLLIVGLGRGTKKLPSYQQLPKTYRVKIKLGVSTDTDDLSGKIIGEKPTKGITREKVEKTLKQFIGKHLQVPPVYSAVKLQGKPAYKLARQGQKPRLTAKEVELLQTKILDFSLPYLALELKTSKGFYVRSFARDLGQVLGCGAAVAELTRTAIGPYKLEKAAPFKL